MYEFCEDLHLSGSSLLNCWDLNAGIDTLIGIGGPFVYKTLSSGASMSVSVIVLWWPSHVQTNQIV